MGGSGSLFLSLGLEPLARTCPPAGGAWALCCPLRPWPQRGDKGGWFPDSLVASGQAVLTELPWAGPWLSCAARRLGAWWPVCVIQASPVTSRGHPCLPEDSGFSIAGHLTRLSSPGLGGDWTDSEQRNDAC